MKLVLAGLVMIASVNTFVTTKDFDTEWIPSNSDYESEASEASFKSVERMAEISSDSEPVNVPVSFNRTYESSHFAKLKNDNSSQRVKILVGCDNSKEYKTNLFICGGCKHPEGHFDTIATHMHSVNGCMPKNGIACKDCKPDIAPLFIKVIDLLNHNKQKHNNLKQWKCGWCGTETSPKRFMKHVAYYTNGKSVKKTFEDYPDRIVVNKSRFIYDKGEVIPNNSKRKIESSTKEVFDAAPKRKRNSKPVDNKNINWLWYKPTIDSDGTKELVKFGEFTVDEMEAMIALKKMPSKVN